MDLVVGGLLLGIVGMFWLTMPAMKDGDRRRGVGKPALSRSLPSEKHAGETSQPSPARP